MEFQTPAFSQVNASFSSADGLLRWNAVDLRASASFYQTLSMPPFLTGMLYIPTGYQYIGPCQGLSEEQTGVDDAITYQQLLKPQMAAFDQLNVDMLPKRTQ